MTKQFTTTTWDRESVELITQILNNYDKKTLVKWATDCAEHVLPKFETKYPKDDRPRKAIAAGRAWLKGKIAVSEVRIAAFAAHDAARSAKDEDAIAAARSAGHAAATVHVAGHAIYASNYAVKAVGQDNIVKEREWQYRRLMKLAENK